MHLTFHFDHMGIAPQIFPNRAYTFVNPALYTSYRTLYTRFFVCS